MPALLNQRPDPAVDRTCLGKPVIPLMSNVSAQHRPLVTHGRRNLFRLAPGPFDIHHLGSPMSYHSSVSQRNGKRVAKIENLKVARFSGVFFDLSSAEHG
jgi:hypothetical protein